MEWIQTWGSSLNITHHIHLCKTKQDIFCKSAAFIAVNNFWWIYILSCPVTSFVATSWCGWHTWVQPDKLLDGLQGRGWIFGNLRTPTVHLGPPGYCHFFNFTMICWHPHTGEIKCACLYLQLNFHLIKNALTTSQCLVIDRNDAFDMH